MSCNANPGTLTATGSGNTRRGAIRNAFRKLVQVGDLECAGGNCAVGSCVWEVESVSFNLIFNVETEDYDATATGSGECLCE